MSFSKYVGTKYFFLRMAVVDDVVLCLKSKAAAVAPSNDNIQTSWGTPTCCSEGLI
jgi:hypothetical protein